VTTQTGDFTSMVRFARGLMHEGSPAPPAKPDEPRIDSAGNLSVRVTARRTDGTQKQGIHPLPQGRVTDKTFAWDAL